MKIFQHMRHIFILIFLLYSMALQSQTDDLKAIKPDVAPKYRGGENALYEFLQSQVRYPHHAKMQGIEGRIYVQFIVTPEGNVRNVKVVKGLGHGLNEEAIRIFEEIPEKFIPGTKSGIAVPVKMIMPIRFEIASG